MVKKILFSIILFLLNNYFNSSFAQNIIIATHKEDSLFCQLYVQNKFGDIGLKTWPDQEIRGKDKTLENIVYCVQEKIIQKNDNLHLHNKLYLRIIVDTSGIVKGGFCPYGLSDEEMNIARQAISFFQEEVLIPASIRKRNIVYDFPFVFEQNTNELIENYFIVSGSKDDSLFCAKHYSFYDFDTNEYIVGSSLPDQMVGWKGGCLFQLQEALMLLLESTFGYDSTNTPSVFHIVIDNMGVTRGVIVNTKQHNSTILELAAHIVFDYLQTEEFTPAILRRKPITYDFTIPARISENNHNENDLEIISTLTSWPVYQNDRTYKKLADFVKYNLRYNDAINETKIVRVKFIIDTVGNTSHHEIVSGESPSLNEEALRVCRLIKFTKPAMQGDKPVSVSFYVPVKFEPKHIIKLKQKQRF